MQFTIQLFNHLYKNLPPLVPESVVLGMQQALENLENNSNISLEEIEDIMIQFGYQVWAWNQAYKYFLTAATEQFGDHFLLPRLSDELRNRYLSFQTYGGTLQDLHSGRPASFFTSEQRAELCERLVEMRQHVKEYVNRDVVGVNQNSYLAKVEEYKDLLEKIKFNLESLRNFVEKEEDGSTLVSEINAKIKDFEHSLCLLGSEMDYEAVCQAQDFFVGRKVELSRMKGINIPMQIDFFNS
ncbi:MAG: hypothetical protein HYT15_00570 [Candidatus Magasanikbacteria bacterium]|nr:hypothetical protein [Candidatus Magasanikbacteria bacterium]